jgi:hypothetical protein
LSEHCLADPDYAWAFAFGFDVVRRLGSAHPGAGSTGPDSRSPAPSNASPPSRSVPIHIWPPIWLTPLTRRSTPSSNPTTATY